MAITTYTRGDSGGDVGVGGVVVDNVQLKVVLGAVDAVLGAWAGHGIG